MPDLADIVANYFERGYRFRRIEAGNAIHTQSPKAVFLIHGWGVRAVSMDHLADALADIDFTVFNYDYPTAERNIEEHAQIFLDLYRRTLRREHIARKVYFLTHSMAGSEKRLRHASTAIAVPATVISLISSFEISES